MHNESKSENNERRTIYNCLAKKKTDDYEERRKIVCHDVDKSNDSIPVQISARFYHDRIFITNVPLINIFI